MEYTHLIEKLNEIGAEVREKYKSKLKANGVYATGKLFDNVNFKLTVKENEMELYFTALDYWIHIEKGREPNSKMPPVDVIKKWMIVRGIPDKPGTAFVIARSIGKKGIKPKPFLRDTKIEVDEMIPQIKIALNKDVKEFVDKNIKGKIKEELNNN